MRQGQVAVLYNRTCGHVGLISTSRASMEDRRRVLALIGYHRWRVEVRDLTDELLVASQADPCPVCFVDVTRLGPTMLDDS